MTKFDFTVLEDKEGKIHIKVVRLFDMAEKKFTQQYGTFDGVCEFMNSITDDLAESYFPKPRKK